MENDKIAKGYKLLNARIKDAKEAQKTAEKEQELWEGVLAIDKTEKISICLSWGGPADYIDFTFKNGELVDMVYKYQDWGYSKEYELSEEDQEALKDIYLTLALDELDKE